MSSLGGFGGNRWSVRLAGVLASLVLLAVFASTAHAQVVMNPHVVSFIPSADHDAVDASGQSIVTEYDLELYVVGTAQPFQVLNLGKPSPSADGFISVDFYSMLGTVPMPGQDLQASVAAVGPGGRGESTLSNSFTYDCAFAASPTSLSIAAQGGSASIGVTAAAAGCGWKATSNAAWITVTGSASGSGNGTVTLDIASNTTTVARTGTVSIASMTVTVTEAAGANTAPTVTLTSPTTGTTLTAPATITLTADARDSDGAVKEVDFLQNGTPLASTTSSPYTFVWTNVAAGSYAITAVAIDTADGRTTSSPVTVTVRANVAPTVGIQSPANGAVFTAPANITLSATAADSDGTVANVQFWANGGAIGTSSTSSTSNTSSSYAVTWPSVGAGSYVITAIATDNAGGTTTSSPVTITVNAPPPPPNVAPAVRLASPANGAAFTAPASITIAATAADSDGTIANVQFWANGGVIGTSSTSSTSGLYAVTWPSVGAGSYVITAMATDNAGATATSSPVSITVNAPPPPPPPQPSPNTAPTVQITSPASGATMTTPPAMTISATAVDKEGPVARVQFYANSGLIGTATTSPYFVKWNPNTSGAYVLTAVAVDAGGLQTTSDPVTITVKRKGGKK